MNASAAPVALVPDVVAAVPPAVRMFAVQIRYPNSEWVTLAHLADHRAAVRRAATAYREAVSPDGALPTQVRLLDGS
ncbi:MAG: hypothetical protein QOJ31_123 [Gaiellales bacterium]|nr:hypothetical protein [Gaiellales bacterium]MDX6549439.1 hypothetical protein [Gaiellales bacterium]